MKQCCALAYLAAEEVRIGTSLLVALEGGVSNSEE